MSEGRRGRSWAVAGPWAVVARLAVSAVLLWLVARFLDVREVLARLSDLGTGWVALGLAISVLQVVALAWRWRYTAARLGIELPLRDALGEYWLSVLLNQVLPGGVAGDVSRAWRHARTAAPTGPAVRAVILERVSGQLVMTTVAIVSALLIPWASVVGRFSTTVVVALVIGLVLVGSVRRASADSLAGRFWVDTKQALLSGSAFPVQLASAVLVVASYIAVFLVAARAVGVDTPLLRLLPLVAPVLMTMLVPVTVAGWGIREGAAAALWSLAGLTPEDGAAISVTYGLLALASSAPGLLVLTRIGIGGRGRRAHPPPA